MRWKIWNWGLVITFQECEAHKGRKKSLVFCWLNERKTNFTKSWYISDVSFGKQKTLAKYWLQYFAPSYIWHQEALQLLLWRLAAILMPPNSLSNKEERHFDNVLPENNFLKCVSLLLLHSSLKNCNKIDCWFYIICLPN